MVIQVADRYFDRAGIGLLAENPYPGRIIVIGRMGKTAVVQLNCLTGRGEDSRNRKFVLDGDTVKVEAARPVEHDDPLRYYNAMRISERGLDFNSNRPRGEWNQGFKRTHVVTNGRQTDAIAEIDDSASTLTKWTYEPDAPTYTSRISATIESGGINQEYMICIARRNENGATTHQIQRDLIDKVIEVGSGLCIHTYETDGNPPPTFKGDPFKIWVGQELSETTQVIWSLLNEENKVAIVGKSIDLETGEVDYQIINRYQAAWEA